MVLDHYPDMTPQNPRGHNLTDEEMERIRAFAASRQYQRRPNDLLPGDDEDSTRRAERRNSKRLFDVTDLLTSLLG